MTNPTGKGGWPEGKSGNPDGRPPKSRAMTAILETAGSRSVVLPDGKKIAGKRWLALSFWELVTTGAVTLPSGKRLEVEPKDWIETGKWLYKHIDGDAPARHELTGAEGGPLTFKVIWGEDDT